MERPEVKPRDRMFGIYQSTVEKGRHVPCKIIEVEYNHSETDDSYHENERDGWFEYDTMIDITFSNRYSDTISCDELDNWFVLDPDRDGLWKWKQEVQKICDEWAKFLRCEAKDLKEWERLQKKFS